MRNLLYLHKLMWLITVPFCMIVLSKSNKKTKLCCFKGNILRYQNAKKVYKLFFSIAIKGCPKIHIQNIIAFIRIVFVIKDFLILNIHDHIPTIYVYYLFLQPNLPRNKQIIFKTVHSHYVHYVIMNMWHTSTLSLEPIL